MTVRKKTFVGFGFGPIQSALFLYEAYCSGNFDRYLIAEVDEGLVGAVRAGGGRYSINIAHPDRIEQVTIDGVRLCHPSDESDRDELVEAIAVADEMVTALPSVRFYDTGGTTSVAELLADGFRQREASKPGIIYAAENHNRAAEVLSERLGEKVSAGALARVLGAYIEALYLPLLIAGALAWVLGFALFVGICGPMMFTKPGRK